MRRHRGLPTRLAIAILGATLCAPLAADSKADKFFEQAKVYYEKGNLKAAVIELKNTLERDPSRVEARVMLAQAYVRQANWAGAEKEMRSARQLGAPPEVWKPVLTEAILMQGRPADALAETELLGDESAALRATLLGLRGEALLATRANADARQAFEAALAAEPGNERARLGIVLLLLAEGRKADGLAALDTLIADAPNNVRARLVRAEVRRVENRPAEAEADYSAAIAVDAGNPQARAGRALVLVMQQRADEAQRDVDALPEVWRNQPLARYLRALIAYQHKDYAATAEHLDYVLRADPQQRQALVLYGALSYAKGDYQLADDFLSRAAAQPAPPVSAIKLLGATRLKLGRPADAIGVLEPLAARSPEDAQLLALLGAAHLQAGDATRGVELLGRAVDIDPDQAALRTQLALGRLAAGDVAGAASDLQAAVDLGQDLVQADVLLVLSHLRAANYPAALQAVDALEQRMPGSAVPANLKGLVMLAQRDYAAADTWFAKAQERDPRFVGARLNRARASAAAGQPQAAAAHYQGVLGVEPRNVAALLGLAALAQEQGDAAKAEEWRVRAHEAQPDAPQPTLLLVQSALRRNDGLRALGLLNELTPAAAETPAAQLLRGMAQLATGDAASAARTLQRVADAQSGSVEAWFQLGRAQLAAGNLDGARASFRRAAELDAAKQFPELRIAQVELELKANNNSQALELTNKFQAEFPQAVEFHDFEAAAARAAGDGARWLRAAQRAYESQPAATRVVVYAQALSASQRSADAVALLQGWVDRQPSDVPVRTALALLLHQAGQRQAAAAAYEQVIARGPENPLLLNNLAVLYQELGDRRAADTARRAYELAPQRPEIVDTYGWILVQGGRVQEGLVMLQQAYVTAPHHPEIAYHVGAALVKAGRKAEARPILERVVREHPGTTAATDAQALLTSAP